jgi:hypothetical protein
MSRGRVPIGSPSAVARVALARLYRDAEGLSIGQIADRHGRSPATIKAYFYDPTGEKARAVKARPVGVCRGCGAYTQPRNGKGDAYAFCKRCHPGAIGRRWTPELVLAAMRDWGERYGPPARQTLASAPRPHPRLGSSDTSWLHHASAQSIGAPILQRLLEKPVR